MTPAELESVMLAFGQPKPIVVRVQGPLIDRSVVGGTAGPKFMQGLYGITPANHDYRIDVQYVRMLAKGSGYINASRSDVAFEIHAEKEFWNRSGGTPGGGEINALFIQYRQGGPSASQIDSGAAILVDMSSLADGGEGGSNVFFEMANRVYAPGDLVNAVYACRAYGGIINQRDGDYYGFVLRAEKGTFDAAVQIVSDSDNDGYWGKAIEVSYGGLAVFTMSDLGKMTWNPTSGGSDRFNVENDAGTLEVSRDDDGVVMALKQSGVVSMPLLPTSSSGLAAGDIWNNGGALTVVT